MITAEMKHSGVICRGKGFNCNKCKDRYECVDVEINNISSVEIRLFNHKTNKVLYENLTMEQLEYILKVLDPKGLS